MTERMIIRLSGPQGCGKTVLRQRLVDMLKAGPVNHHPVTIYDGGEIVVTIDRRIAKERHR